MLKTIDNKLFAAIAIIIIAYALSGCATRHCSFDEYLINQWCK